MKSKYYWISLHNNSLKNSLTNHSGKMVSINIILSISIILSRKIPYTEFIIKKLMTYWKLYVTIKYYLNKYNFTEIEFQSSSLEKYYRKFV